MDVGTTTSWIVSVIGYAGCLIIAMAHLRIWPMLVATLLASAGLLINSNEYPMILDSLMLCAWAAVATFVIPVLLLDEVISKRLPVKRISMIGNSLEYNVALVAARSKKQSDLRRTLLMDIALKYFLYCFPTIFVLIVLMESYQTIYEAIGLVTAGSLATLFMGISWIYSKHIDGCYVKHSFQCFALKRLNNHWN